MTILITGGTSGLGLALVRSFLKKGCYVVATGRQNGTIDDNSGRFKLIKVDFSSLRKTADAIKSICRDNQFDLVVNNAGVLSPPDFMLTEDGNEYTFQVNFLAHLLINEIIVRNRIANS